MNVLLRTTEIENDNTNGVVLIPPCVSSSLFVLRRGRLRGDILSYLHCCYSAYRYTANTLPQKSILSIPIFFLRARQVAVQTTTLFNSVGKFSYSITLSTTAEAVLVYSKGIYFGNQLLRDINKL